MATLRERRLALAKAGLTDTDEISVINQASINEELSRIEVEEKLESTEIGFFEAVQENIVNTSLTQSIFDFSERITIKKEFYDDPSMDEYFDLGDSEIRKHYMEGLPSSSIAIYESIVTKREADFVHQRELEKMEFMKQLSVKHGFSQFLIQSLDPVNLGFMLASGGLGLIGRVNSVGKNVARFAKLGAAEEIAYEALMDLTTAGYEANYGQSALIGSTIGGALGFVDARFLNHGSVKTKIKPKSEKTDVDTAGDLEKSIQSQAQDKAFKVNNHNILNEKQITKGQVQDYSINKVRSIEVEQVNNKARITAIDKILSLLNKQKKPKVIKKDLLSDKKKIDLGDLIRSTKKELDEVTTPEMISVRENLDPDLKQKIDDRVKKLLKKTDEEGKTVDIDFTFDDILKQAVKQEKSILKGKRTKLSNVVKNAEELISKHNKSIKADDLLEQRNRRVSKLKGEKTALQRQNKSLDESKKRYSESSELDPIQRETNVNTGSIYANMNKSLIDEYDVKLKERDVDDVNSGGHDLDLDPRYVGDVKSTSDDFVNAELKDVSDAMDDVIKTGTEDGFGKSKIEAIRTLAESIVNSNIKAVRKLGAVIQTQFRTVDGDTAENIIGSLTVQDDLINKIQTKFYNAEQEAILNYRNTGGTLRFDKNYIFNDDNWRKLNDDVTRWSRGERDINVFNYTDDKYLKLITELSEKTDPLFQELFDRLKKSGHEFADDLGSVDNYRNRRFQEESIANWDLKYDEDSIVSALKKWIEEAQPDLVGKQKSGKDFSETIATGYWSVLKNSAYGLDEISHKMSKGSLADDALNAIENQLRIQGLEEPITKQFIDAREQIKKQITKEKDTKSRLFVNETGTAKLIDKETGASIEVRFDELLLNNNRLLLESYTNKMSGFISMAETADRYNLPTMKKVNFFQDIKDEALKEMKTTDTKKREKISDLIEFTEAMMYKRPYKHFNSNMSKLAQGFGALIYSTQLGFLPITMAIETGKMAQMASWKFTLQALKENSIDKLMKKIAGDTKPDEMNDFMEFMIGNNDYYSYNVSVRSDLGENLSATAKGLDKFVKTTDKLAKSSSILSGARVADKALRDSSFKALIYNFADMARKGELTSDIMTKHRLISAFINPETMAKINKGLLKHGKYNKRGGLISVDYTKWNLEDSKTLTNFMFGIKKLSNHMVQAPNPSSLPIGLQSPMARIVFNLRTFSIQEFSDTLTYNVHMKDRSAVLGLMYTTLMAGVSYTAYVNLNAIGRSDADEYRKKMLDPQRVMLNSIARLGWIMPFTALVDTLYGVGTGGESLFYGARSSGNTVSFINGIPAVGYFGNVANTVQQTVSGALGTDDFTQSDFRNAVRVLPFSSLPYIRMSTNMMGDELFGED